MNRLICGIHHVTAIAGDPQRNIDFYVGALGLRLVKLTVNFDDPFTHHLYYGDGHGSPGTILTFFPWPAAGKGSPGTGQVTATAFAVPEGTLEFWTKRLAGLGIDVDGPFTRFGETLVSMSDPDGMKVELVATARGDAGKSWNGGPVPGHSAIRGLHHITLSEEGYERTATLLTVTLGFALWGRKAIASAMPWVTKHPGRLSTWNAHRIGPLAGSRSGASIMLPGAPPMIPNRKPGVGKSRVWDTMSRQSWTGIISIRSTSASQAASFSRSRPIPLVSPSMSRLRVWDRSCAYLWCSNHIAI